MSARLPVAPLIGMTNGRSYRRQLESYIRSRAELRGEWLERRNCCLPIRQRKPAASNG